MSDSPKLDWVPLYIHRLKASDAWHFPPHVFGWYIRLLIEATDSPRPGFLPNDPARLCELGNAWGKDISHRPRNWQHIQAKFAEAWRLHLSAKFPATDDLLWVHNPAASKVLVQQERKMKKPPPPDSSLSLSKGVGVVSEPDGESLYRQFHEAHPRSTGGCAEEHAFMEACRQDEAEAQRIIAAAKLYREAVESGDMGHQPARAVNWLRDRVYNENPSYWRKGVSGDARSDRNKQAIRTALAELAD